MAGLRKLAADAASLQNAISDQQSSTNPHGVNFDPADNTKQQALLFNEEAPESKWWIKLKFKARLKGDERLMEFETYCTLRADHMSVVVPQKFLADYSFKVEHNQTIKDFEFELGSQKIKDEAHVACNAEMMSISYDVLRECNAVFLPGGNIILIPNNQNRSFDILEIQHRGLPSSAVSSFINDCKVDPAKSNILKVLYTFFMEINQTLAYLNVEESEAAKSPPPITEAESVPDSMANKRNRLTAFGNKK